MQEIPLQGRASTEIGYETYDHYGQVCLAISDFVRYTLSSERTTHGTAKTSAKKLDKIWLNETCMDVSAFPKTGEVSISKNKTNHVSGSIELIPSRMRLVLCLLDTCAGLNLTHDEVLDLIWLDSICPRNKPDTCIASDTKSTLSGTPPLISGWINCALPSSPPLWES